MQSPISTKFSPEHVFFTSDTHFNHSNIIRFCNRPFHNVEEMNETIIRNWNSVVAPDDIVFHLGNFCLGGAAEWTKILERLNGRIYLILGNHDLKNIRQGFISRFEHVTMHPFWQWASEHYRQAISRNRNLLSEDKAFHLTYEEHIEWFNISYPSNKVRKSDYRPYVLTPTGLLLLSLRVNSPLAIKTDIRIIRTVSSKISIFELPKQIKQQS